MIKSLQCILLVSSVLSVSLFGGKNIGLTKEIDNLREAVICSVETQKENGSGLASEESGMTLGYTDSFWVEEDETAYLLDTYGKRVLEFSKGNYREILLSDTVLPADVVTCNDKIVIYDDLLFEVQIYTKQGELYARNAVHLENDYVKRLSCINDTVLLETYGYCRYLVDTENANLTLQEGWTLPEVTADGYDYAEYQETDEDGTVYSVHTTLVKNSIVICGEMTLRAVSAEGVLKGSYILPVTEYAYLPDRYVQVHQNGNIYLLVPSETTVEIRKISLASPTESALAELEEETRSLENVYADKTRTRKRKGTSCEEEPVYSREETRQRAFAMADYQWTLKKSYTNTSRDIVDKGVVLPREIAYLKEKHAGESSWKETVTGLPYCWGGFYALDTGFKGNTFKKMLNNGYIAGNINPEGHLKYPTAGVDCSGYVGASLGLTQKYNTSALSDIGSGVKNIRELEQMDIFVYPGEHVIFFCEWMDDATALVAEAAIREGKVVVHPKSINEFVINGQYQMRSPW